MHVQFQVRMTNAGQDWKFNLMGRFENIIYGQWPEVFKNDLQLV